MVPLFKYSWLTLVTLIFFNLARLTCSRFFLQTTWYQTILYDQYHHYQLGILITILSLIFIKNRQVKYPLISIAIGMIIDESMYVVGLFGFNNFDHYHFQGISFEFLLFWCYSQILKKLV